MYDIYIYHPKNGTLLDEFSGLYGKGDVYEMINYSYRRHGLVEYKGLTLELISKLSMLSSDDICPNELAKHSKKLRVIRYKGINLEEILYHLIDKHEKLEGDYKKLEEENIILKNRSITID
jgi:hypothetical protein